MGMSYSQGHQIVKLIISFPPYQRAYVLTGTSKPYLKKFPRISQDDIVEKRVGDKAC